MKRSNKASSSKSSKELPFMKWYKGMISGEANDMVQQFSLIRPILSDPAYSDATFAALVSLGLPKESWISTPWSYEVEKGRFRAAFIRGKNNPTGNILDQPRYIGFVMKLLNRDNKFYTVEELKNHTLVESLKFMITFVTTAVEAEKEVSPSFKIGT